MPNAPYLLTDIIHLIRAIRSGFSIWIIMLFFLPVHLLAIFCGFEAYVIALLNQGSYLKRQGVARWIVPTELLTHALGAIGVYLGWFRRFNSWDLVTEPGNILLQTLEDLTAKRPLAVTALIFVIINLLYWVMKQVILGIWLRLQYYRLRREVESE